jgi:hypothetical protein
VFFHNAAGDIGRYFAVGHFRFSPTITWTIGSIESRPMLPVWRTINIAQVFFFDIIQNGFERFAGAGGDADRAHANHDLNLAGSAL